MKPKERLTSNKTAKSDSPSTNVGLLKIRSDESIFNSFYTNARTTSPGMKKAKVLLKISSTGEDDMNELVKLADSFYDWSLYDYQNRPGCCLDKTKEESKCDKCREFSKSQNELVDFAIARIYEKACKLIAPKISAIKSQRNSKVFYEISSCSGKSESKMSLLDFLRRIAHSLQVWSSNSNTVIIQGVHSHIGLYSLFFAYSYILRLKKAKKMYLTNSNVRNVFLSAALVAFKVINDKDISLLWYAKTTNVDVDQLIKMEFEICRLLDYDLDVESKLLVDLYTECVPYLEEILIDVRRHFSTSES